MEGKWGNRRDIGESAVFIPVACSKETLLFSDFRFKADNQDNREVNLGLGIRALKETGVLGGYGYYDRKISGVSDKYHSQLTIGGEWLAENWEARLNGYVPLSEEVSIVSGGSGLSAPFLSGSGIFARETAQRVLKEIPLYGGDAEIGFKIPDSKFWIHAGGFSFTADDAPSLNGARTRATFQFTDNIALTAEGQYDDERGRQGWLGLRITLPFNEPAEKPLGPATRMTASPVRDVDIVTETKQETIGTDRLVPVINIQTGAPQRVLYVDNSALAGGTGTLDSPFNSLSDAEAALADNDVLYITSGDGSAAGMSDGLLIDNNNVRVIGEGSNFIYDGAIFTTNTNTDFSGTILRAAGTAPKITNATLGGDGITIAASNILLSGLSIENANRYGVYALENSGGSLDDIMLHNLTVTGSGEDGIRIQASGAGSQASATIKHVTATGNKNGIRFYAHDNASITGTVQSTMTVSNTQHGLIVYDDSTAGSVDVDLGGGGRSTGNNAFFGNILEDLALDIDGGTLSAQNNWWGQASGADQDDPSDGQKTQIYYGAPINNGLIGHWTFDTEWVNGTVAYDRSGQANNGTMQGGLSASNITAGTNRQALRLDGINDAIALPSSNAFVPANNSPISYMARYSAAVIPGAILDVRIINLRRTAASTTLAVGIGSNNRVATFTVDNNIQNMTGVTIATNTSYLSGATYDGTTFTPYHDGVARTPVSSPNSVRAGDASPAYIGAFDNTRFFHNGLIDDVRIYNRALTTGEMAEINRMNTSSLVDVSNPLSGAP